MTTYRACLGKARFATYTHADRVARRARGMAPYRCFECGGWHVGHSVGRGRKPGARGMKERRAGAA